MTLEAFGVRLAVRVDHPALTDVVHSRLRLGSKPYLEGDCDVQFAVWSRDGFHYQLLREDEPLGPTVELEVALAMLDACVCSEVAQRAQGALLIQGGAVALGDRALVLPGRSFSGTSTLIQELVAHGATFVSDDYALLDEQGRVSSSGAELAPRRVGLLAATIFVPGAPWLPHELGPAEAALILLSHSVTLRDDPARTMEVVRYATAGASALESERGEAAEVASRLLERLDHG